MRRDRRRRLSARLADGGQADLLLGLGGVGYGAMVYPPIALAMAAANGVFVLCCVAAFIAGRMRRGGNST